MNYFAHAEELHDDSTSDIEHLLTQPLVALALFILIALALWYLLRALKLPTSNILLVELALFFAVGIGSYTLVPALSIFALTAGITGALFLTLTMLAKH